MHCQAVSVKMRGSEILQCVQKLQLERAPRRSRRRQDSPLVAIDLMIGGMVLWSAYRPGLKYVPRSLCFHYRNSGYGLPSRSLFSS